MEGHDYIKVIFKADPVSDGSFKAAMPLYCCWLKGLWKNMKQKLFGLGAKMQRDLH